MSSGDEERSVEYCSAGICQAVIGGGGGGGSGGAFETKIVRDMKGH